MAKGDARHRKVGNKNGTEAKSDSAADAKKGAKSASAKQGGSGVCQKLIILVLLVAIVVGALIATGVIKLDQIPGLEEAGITKRAAESGSDTVPPASKQDTKPKEEKKEAPKVKESAKKPPKPSETKKEPSKPKETKKEPPKHTETKKEPPKPTETKKEPPKPTETKKEPPKPTETKKDAAKPAETKKETPKPTETKKEAPKPTETKKEPPKPTEANKEAPKPTETKKEAPKPTETKKEAPKPTETKKEAPKPTETKKEAPKPTETKKEAPKPSETQKEAPKPTETKKETPKPTETKKETPKPSDTAEGKKDAETQTDSSEAAGKSTKTKLSKEEAEITNESDEIILSQLKKTQSLLDKEASKPAETKKEVPKPAETKKEAPKPTEIKKEAPKPTERKKEAFKPTETEKEQPKPAETKKEPPKPTEAKKEAPEPAETKKEASKPTETKEAPKPTETKKEAPKPTDTQKEVPKPTETQKEAPKPTETKKETPKPTETKKETPKPSDTAEGKKDAETQTDSSKAAGKSTKTKLSKEEAEITNERDKIILSQLKDPQTLLAKGKYELALRRYETLLVSYPSSPLVRWGRAQALDRLAEERRSNDLLQSCIQAYTETADAPDCPRMLKKKALTKAADRLSFFGKVRRASNIYFNLAEEFPDDLQIKKNLGVQLLIGGMNSQAKPVFEDILQRDPNDGFAKVHLGFILKADTYYKEAIPLLMEGIASGEDGTQEGKYFFHLGDALYRENRPEEAYKVYQQASDRGFFRSVYQRSLYNVETLKARPWWTHKEAKFIEAAKQLESNWEIIRDEGMALLDPKSKEFVPEDENLRETGDWKQFTLFQQGRMVEENCKKAPKTCAIVDAIDESATCKRGQIKFSVMHPGTHVWPHCGPTNCRLRGHLGLVIPDGCRIRVANETRTWHEGKLMIFDDSFEHEVWQEADSVRLILIVDLWHPGLTSGQKHMLTPI